jgi:dinuclear metal center YbgI/SA1388 family protein
MVLSELLDFLDYKFPQSEAEEWDNSGNQIINPDQNIKKVLITIDITKKAIKKAKEIDADLVISHHPFIFSPIRSIELSSYKGKIIRDVIENKINLYSLHTNYDSLLFGMNLRIMEKLELINGRILKKKENRSDSGFGMVGDLKEPIDINKFIEYFKNVFNIDYIILYENTPKKNISKIAFCGGAGTDFIIDAVQSGAQLYITGDVTHHDAQLAYEQDIALLDATHYGLEKIFITHMEELIKEKFPNLIIEKYEHNDFEGIVK